MPIQFHSTRMKILQTIRHDLALIGYSANQHPYNIQQLEHGFKSTLAAAMQCVYLFFIAETSKEFIDSTFMATVAILVLISFVSTAQKTTIIFNFIDEVEKIANNSEFRINFCSNSICPIIVEDNSQFIKITGLHHPKSKKMYEKTNRLAEKCSKIICFLIMKMSIPGFVLPKAIFSYFRYFTTDAGPNAFELPILAW